MTEKEIRLECIKLAVMAKRKSQKIDLGDQELAEVFAEFCKADDVKFGAMKMAVETMKSRVDVESILQTAFSYKKFSDGPKVVPKKEAYRKVHRNRLKSR